mmetsp:Transcript_20388/g.46813  ORF Transcript_20388/g.46813 Transcript_20388/m.46813 type:complete len:336 (+) Transcript_20388:54-1061(+)
MMGSPSIVSPGFVIALGYLVAVNATRPVEPYVAHALRPSHDVDKLEANVSSSLLMADAHRGARCCCKKGNKKDVTEDYCKIWTLYRNRRAHWYHNIDWETKACCWIAKRYCGPTFAFLLSPDNNGGSKVKAASAWCPADDPDHPPVKPDRYMYAHASARLSAKLTINAAFLTRFANFAVSSVQAVVSPISGGHQEVIANPVGWAETTSGAADSWTMRMDVLKQLADLGNSKGFPSSNFSTPTRVESQDTGRVTLLYDNLNKTDLERVPTKGETKCSEITMPLEEDEEDGEEVKSLKTMTIGAICVANRDGEIDAVGTFELNEKEEVPEQPDDDQG